MKLIMAVSKEGFVSRTAKDDMSWTGSTDKAVFRSLTCVGGSLACGSVTWGLMPVTLPGRRLFKLTSKIEGCDLQSFQRAEPNGWLVGGQKIALAALDADLVDQAFICRSMRYCFPTPSASPYLLGHRHLREEYSRHNPPWTKSSTIKFGTEVEVDVWNRQR